MNDFNYWESKKEFSVLLGKTLTEIRGDKENDLVFVCADGDAYRMEHFQDCCERVSIEDICGDLNDLIGAPILVAEEVESGEWPTDREKSEYCESFTWTFYKLATIRGSVTIRWLGESNGYYSESFNFWQSAGVTPPTEPGKAGGMIPYRDMPFCSAECKTVGV